MYLNDVLINGEQNSVVRLLLAHGAGAPMDSPFMSEFAQSLASFGVQVIRFEFPYMQKRRQTGVKRPPDRQAVLLSFWQALVEKYTADGQPVVIGGKSMGGRMASLYASEADDKVKGVVCLGYPFHPPGKPESIRTAHLQEGAMYTSHLILQGERDPFGKRVEVEGYPLSRCVQVSWVNTGDHDFKPLKSSGVTQGENIAFAAKKAAQFILSLG